MMKSLRTSYRAFPRVAAFPIALPAVTVRWPGLMTALAALIAVLLAATIYAVWLPSRHSGDDLQYATIIQQSVDGRTFFHPAGLTEVDPAIPPSGEGRLSVPVNPRYLLEWPTSIAAASLWDAAGWNGDVVTPVLVLRIVAGAVGLLFFFLAVRLLTTDSVLSLLATLGLATTVSYWTYSTHLDQSINMIALLCVAFYLAVRRAREPGNRWILAGLALSLAFATLYNFTGAIPALLVGVFVGATAPGGGSLYLKAREAITFYVLYGVTVVVILLGGVALLESPSAIVDPAYWSNARFSGHPEYDVAPVRDAFRSALGIAKSQIAYPATSGSLQAYWDTAGADQKLQVLAYYGVVLLLIAVPLLLVVRHRKQLGSKAPVVALLGGIFLAYSIFNWWWDPGYVKYWLIPLLAWWGLVAIALATLKQAGSALYRPVVAAVAVVIVITFAMNVTTIFQPESGENGNEWRAIADELKASPPNALFISTGAHPLDFNISYFTRRDVVSTDLVLYSQGFSGDQFVTDLLARRVDRYERAGAPIYLYGLESLSPDALPGYMSLFDVSRLRAAWTFEDLTVYEYDYNGER